MRQYPPARDAFPSYSYYCGTWQRRPRFLVRSFHFGTHIVLPEMLPPDCASTFLVGISKDRARRSCFMKVVDPLQSRLMFAVGAAVRPSCHDARIVIRSVSHWVLQPHSPRTISPHFHIIQGPSPTFSLSPPYIHHGIDNSHRDGSCRSI